MEPIGILKYHNISIKQNKAAVYYDIYFIDEAGNIFKGNSAHFLFDLKQATEPAVEADACMSAGCPNNKTGIGNDELCNCKRTI